MAISYDQSQARSSGSGNSLSFTSQVGTGSDILLFTEIAWFPSSISISGVLYGSSAMTQASAASTSGNVGIALWYLVGPGSNSAATVNVSFSGSTTVSQGRSYSFFGVDQSSTFSDTQTNTGSSVTSLDVTLSCDVSNQALVIAGASEAVDLSPGTNCTRAAGSGSNNPFPGYYLISGGSGSYTIGVTDSTDNIAAVAVAMRPSGAAVTGKPWIYYAGQFQQSQ